MLPCETGGSYLDKALSHHGVLHALLYMSINPTEMRLHLLFTISVILLDMVMEYPGENAWCTMTSSSAYQAWGDYMQMWYFLVYLHPDQSVTVLKKNFGTGSGTTQRTEIFHGIFRYGYQIPGNSPGTKFIRY